MSTLAFPFFIGSSLFLQVTRTTIKTWMGSKYGKIGPGSTELAALNFFQIPSPTTELAAPERLKNECLML